VFNKKIDLGAISLRKIGPCGQRMVNRFRILRAVCREGGGGNKRWNGKRRKAYAGHPIYPRLAALDRHGEADFVQFSTKNTAPDISRRQCLICQVAERFS
jgi:hypothetical protein